MHQRGMGIGIWVGLDLSEMGPFEISNKAACSLSPDIWFAYLFFSLSPEGGYNDI